MNDTDTIHGLLNLWHDFENELIYRNRFFPKTDSLLCMIKELTPILESSFEEGFDWYRAREFNVNKYNPNDYDFLSEDEWENENNKFLDTLLFYNASMNSDNLNTILKSKYEESTRSSVWGYSKKDSGIPPRDYAGVNRASPRYISYLYLADNIDTALAEVRAQVGQPISVAKYRLLKTLKIVDLCRIHEVFNDKSSYTELFLCIQINKAFSSPAISSDKDYLVSQYIAEFIKTLGYDGIAFDSARNFGGINLTLFDDSKCDFLGSEVHEVTSIKIKSKRILPPKVD